MSKKIFAIIWREYVTRVRTKGFIIGTLITPVFMAIVFGGIFIFALLFTPETKKITVIDESGQIFNKMSSMLCDTLKGGIPEYEWVLYETNTVGADSAALHLQHMVMSKEIDAYLNIPKNIFLEKKVRYSARSVSDWEELAKIDRAISRIVTDHYLTLKGVSPDSIRAEFEKGKIELITHQVTDEGEVSKGSVSSFILTYILAYLLFLLVMIYGQIVSRSVIEEKSQRITETIVSSVKPVDLLVGKITGICLLGLTQLFIIGLFFLLASAYAAYGFMSFGINSPELMEIMNEMKFSVSVFGFLLLYFLLGFMFYATMYAGIGSVVNTEDEAQQAQTALIFIIIISFFLMFTAAKAPESTMAYWISIVPLFSPVVGFARVAVTDPMLPDGIIISVIVLILSVTGAIWLVSKIYRVGILMYGKKPNMREIIRWMKHN